MAFRQNLLASCLLYAKYCLPTIEFRQKRLISMFSSHENSQYTILDVRRNFSWLIARTFCFFEGNNASNSHFLDESLKNLVTGVQMFVSANGLYILLLTKKQAKLSLQKHHLATFFFRSIYPKKAAF